MNEKAILFSKTKLSSSQINEVERKFDLNSLENKIDKNISAGFILQIGDIIHDYTVSSISDGKKTETKSVGIVKSISDGVAVISGLSTVMYQEIVEFEGGIKGLALNLEKDNVKAIILENEDKLLPGHKVSTTGQILSIPVSEGIIGRTVNSLGKQLDKKGELKPDKFMPLEKIAPGVMDRKAVDRPLFTGITAVDAMIPVGRGQRELIIGDRQTGKTSVALTTIINQKDVICIYVAIGQKRSNVALIKSILEKNGALEHTIIVSATASDSAAMQYLAPYSGTAIAEYFLEKGKDVLIVYDDLTKHAWAYRQISLLLGRPSGREAYPGDIFYAHSRLLERSCQLNKKLGGGSITALPIIETLEGDVSAYVPTNVISITDGQIYLQTDLFNEGQRPAIDVGNSVSRVGSSAQTKTMKQVAGKLRLDLAQFRELEAFAQFASELDEKTQSQLNRGAKLYEILKQGWEVPISQSEQIVLLWTGINGYSDDISKNDFADFKIKLLENAKLADVKLLDDIAKTEKLDEKLEERIKKIIPESS